MACANKRSLSPAPREPELKRTKKTHVSSVSSSDVLADPTPQFAHDLLSQQSVQRLRTEYANNQPFKYCRIEKLVQDDLLAGVKDECLSELSFTEKETDIYKVCFFFARYTFQVLVLTMSIRLFLPLSRLGSCGMSGQSNR